MADVVVDRMDRVFLVGAIVFVVGVISGVGILVILGSAWPDRKRRAEARIGCLAPGLVVVFGLGHLRRQVSDGHGRAGSGTVMA